jgi:hypothetical protein
MNANELADELEHYLKGEEYDRLVWEIPDLLRQQQAEIDSLKKFIAESNALDKKLFESIKKSNEMWNRATKSILKKAQDEQ